MFEDPEDCCDELLDLIHSKMVLEEFEGRKFFYADDKDCLKNEMEEYRQEIISEEHDFTY